MRLTKECCIFLLRDKHRETGRYPKKSDFSEEEVSMIKSYFGPWPRALEVAGIKAPRDNNKVELRRQKRVEMKRAKNAQRKELNKNDVAEKKGKVEK